MPIAMFVARRAERLSEHGAAGLVRDVEGNVLVEQHLNGLEPAAADSVVRTREPRSHPRVRIDSMIDQIRRSYRLPKHTRGGEYLVQRFTFVFEIAFLVPLNDLIMKAFRADRFF